MAGYHDLNEGHSAELQRFEALEEEALELWALAEELWEEFEASIGPGREPDWIAGRQASALSALALAANERVAEAYEGLDRAIRARLAL
ncbi:MAG: hypothetical protein JRD89_14965 [Deltaproteobacteria bacterium]|nr:hypothetical protein [Deltaproteobacteria bacterium]